MMLSFDKFYENLGFSQKLQLVQAVAKGGDRLVCERIRLDGFVEKRTEYAVTCDDGEYYVYLWKHLDGDVFYVGSGKNNRCIQRNRGVNFLKHIDKGDAVLYIVAQGLSKNGARFYERYISGCISFTGVQLVNKDNNIERIGFKKFEEWLQDNSEALSDPLTKDIEDIILNKILTDDKFSARTVLGISAFIELYGHSYFSDYYERVREIS